MDLKSTYIWKTLLGLSGIIFLYFIYIDISQLLEYNELLDKLNSEEIGTDIALQNKISNLENTLADKEKFVFDLENNPTNLSRIIHIDGLESFFGISSKDIVLKGIAGTKALIMYQNNHISLSVNDTISGGKIISIDDESIEFKKDGSITKYTVGNN
jgi:uncharacterized protein YbcI